MGVKSFRSPTRPPFENVTSFLLLPGGTVNFNALAVTSPEARRLISLAMMLDCLLFVKNGRRSLTFAESVPVVSEFVFWVE